MIWRIVLVLLLILGAILIYAASKPAEFRIQRTVLIQAPAEKIFPLIDDFHNWHRWAPQDREDATMERNYSGPASGEGAESQWRGAGSSGSGSMRITKSTPVSDVVIEVNFVQPFKTRNINEFHLEGQGAATKVTWSMHGPNLFVMKLMSVFANMDRVMGKHFESGLENLKHAAES